MPRRSLLRATVLVREQFRALHRSPEDGCETDLTPRTRAAKLHDLMRRPPLRALRTSDRHLAAFNATVCSQIAVAALLRRYLREPGDELRALRGHAEKVVRCLNHWRMRKRLPCTGAIGRCAPGWGDCAVAPGCETRLTLRALRGLRQPGLHLAQTGRPAESPWVRPAHRQPGFGNCNAQSFDCETSIDVGRNRPAPEVRRNDHRGPVRSLLCKRRHRTDGSYFVEAISTKRSDFDPTGCGRRANADRLVRRVRDQYNSGRYLRLAGFFR